MGPNKLDELLIAGKSGGGEIWSFSEFEENLKITKNGQTVFQINRNRDFKHIKIG